MSCHGLMKNINPIFILKCPKRMFEYYLSKEFPYFDHYIINFIKLPNEVKSKLIQKIQTIQKKS